MYTQRTNTIYAHCQPHRNMMGRCNIRNKELTTYPLAICVGVPKLLTSSTTHRGHSLASQSLPVVPPSSSPVIMIFGRCSSPMRNTLPANRSRGFFTVSRIRSSQGMIHLTVGHELNGSPTYYINLSNGGTD